MSLKLIGFLCIIGLVVSFVAFNLDNRSDISFGFASIPSVPVFVSIFSGFVLGILASLPYGFSNWRRFRKLQSLQKKGIIDGTPAQGEPPTQEVSGAKTGRHEKS